MVHPLFEDSIAPKYYKYRVWTVLLPTDCHHHPCQTTPEYPRAELTVPSLIYPHIVATFFDAYTLLFLSTMPFRQPLRDRCNTLLRVCTDLKPSSTKSKLRPNLTSSAGNTPPPSVPRPRESSPPPLPTGPMQTLEDLPANEDIATALEFVPYLHLFSPSSPSTLPPGRWTHAVRLLPATEEHSVGSTIVTACGHTQFLNLYMPLAAPQNDTILPINTRHLLIARDFLALALPYYASAHPFEDETASPTPLDALSPPPPQACRMDAVRVVLCGPQRAVLTIALAYLAYASGFTVSYVMRCVSETQEEGEGKDEDDNPAWGALLGPDGQMGLGAREIRILDRLAKKEL
ncbi:hypothetical protein DFH07DRAFT_858996 [Mycena maculata]|uniref:Uncharacterized protein n=1 Tax=Mycena maculata TaxID=230809 RepID=A0AAD7HG24_9AGAR|nr:hypothetical protein DFH07DRAFT_858996 [Mycena maculata]